MKKFSLVVVLIVTVTIQGNTQNTLSNIIENGEIRIGMTGNQPPYSMEMKNGKLMGYEVDLAIMLAESMGVKLNIVEMAFSELMPTLENGKVHAVMSGMKITPQRNLSVLFSSPYSLSGKSILTKSKVLAEISEAEEINANRYKITCLKGSTSEQFVRAFMPKSEIVLVENYEKGVDMVANDQADALVADFPICMLAVLRNKDLVTLDEPLTLEPIGIALPSNDLHFLNLIDNYVDAIELSGDLELLDQIWFEDDQWIVNMK